jgi:hypothetical protein
MLPALPFIAIGVAAAAAGWAGATVWQRLYGERDDAARTGVSAKEADGWRDARSLAWCPACRTYFVAGEAHGCDAPDCPRRR